MTAKMDLTALLAAQTQGRFFGPQAPEAYDKPTNIVVAGNGIFRVVKTPVALFKTKIQDIPAASRLPGLPDMEEGPELLVPKIPMKYWIMALTWYQDVHKKDKTEASVLFFWNHDSVELPEKYEDNTDVKGLVQDGQLVIYCPQQKNSGTLSEFGDDGMVNYLREHCTPFMETHSHHTMDAYFSGTDNANENATQFYGVWGKILDKQPKFAFRWVCGDKKIEIDPSVLIDIPQIETKTITTVKVIRTVPGQEPVETEEQEEEVTVEALKGPWERVEAPEDWMAQHRKSWPSYKSGSYNSSAYNRNYNQNKGTTGGGATPSTEQWADPYYNSAYGLTGYEDDYYYGAGQYSPTARRATAHGAVHPDDVGTDSLPVSFGAQAALKKKLVNETSTEEGATTAVEIFLENLDESDPTTGAAEELVREMVQELIHLGYDQVIADIVDEDLVDTPYQSYESH